MTNQSSALREPEREQDHLRPPAHLTPKSETLDTTTTSTNSNAKRLKPERCSPSPTRHHQHDQQTQDSQQYHSQQQLHHSHSSIHHHLSQSVAAQQIQSQQQVSNIRKVNQQKSH